MVGLGCIAPMCKMLDSKDISAVKIALDGLHNILRIADDEAATITTLIEECGGELLNEFYLLTHTQTWSLWSASS